MRAQNVETCFFQLSAEYVYYMISLKNKCKLESRRVRTYVISYSRKVRVPLPGPPSHPGVRCRGWVPGVVFLHRKRFNLSLCHQSVLDLFSAQAVQDCSSGGAVSRALDSKGSGSGSKEARASWCRGGVTAYEPFLTDTTPVLNTLVRER